MELGPYRDWSSNFLKQFSQRETLGGRCSLRYERSRQATIGIIKRLGLEAELQGHSGCVNCLEWNQHGNLLLSGSDDRRVIIWDAFSHRRINTLTTTHTGNIFSSKFMPGSGDRHIATCAADCKVTIIDAERSETLNIFSCHRARVKRLAVSQELPHMLFSAGEDGYVMQFDLRCPENYAQENSENIIVNLPTFTGELYMEAKCLDLHPTRSDILAVGASDAYVRLYDRRMLHTASAQSTDDVCRNCVQYFLPGHITSMLDDYSRRYRSLAATDVSFSPDGKDLLVNLGGEQIYLYDLHQHQEARLFDTSDFEASLPKCGTTNYLPAVEENGRSHSEHEQTCPPSIQQQCSITDTLPPNIELLKQKANHEFERLNYGTSIDLYNRAIHSLPCKAVLYSNRAAALIRRNWDGDVYAALKDCVTAISLNPQQYKALYRLCRCLLQLKRVAEADAALTYFKMTFPQHAEGHTFTKLQEDIQTALASNKSKVNVTSRESELERDDDSDDSAHVDGLAVNGGRKTENEEVWRASACDYSQRFCGHCNLTTDIKEASFIGRNGQFVCAGSDDGSFFIWDRETTNIVRVLKGDEVIVNCLQPHPEVCMLATSGIDSTVKLWSPKQEGVKQQEEVEKFGDAASANQRRMNADPLELMLMNMGYRVNYAGSDGSEAEHPGAEGGPADMQCRPF